MGSSKPVHTTELMAFITTNKISDIAKQNIVPLFKGMFTVRSPFKIYYSYAITIYIANGPILPGTFVSNILSVIVLNVGLFQS